VPMDRGIGTMDKGIVPMDRGIGTMDKGIVAMDRGIVTILPVCTAGSHHPIRVNCRPAQ